MNLKGLTKKTINYIKNSNSYREHYNMVKGVTVYSFDDIKIERSFSSLWLAIFKNEEEVFRVSYNREGTSRESFLNIIEEIEKKEKRYKQNLLANF